MSGQDCNVFATATQYATSHGVVYQTNYFTSQQVTNNVTVYVPMSVVRSYTSAQVFPTATLYGTSCNSAAAQTSVYAAADASATAPTAASVTSGVLVSTEQSLQTVAGGNVQTRTIVHTVSASVALVTHTASQNATAQATANNAADGSTTQKQSSHTGAIAGGIVGIVALFALLALLAWCIRRRLRRARDTRNLDDFFNDPSSVGWRPEEQQGGEGGTLSRRASTFLVGSLARRKSQDGILDLEKESRRSNEHAKWAELVEDEGFVPGTSDKAAEELTEIPSGRPSSQLQLRPPSRAASPRSMMNAADRSRHNSIHEQVSEAPVSGARTVSFGSGEGTRLSPRLRPLTEYQSLDPDWENAVTSSPGASPRQQQLSFSPSRQADLSLVPQRPASALGIGAHGIPSRHASYGPSPPRSPQGSVSPGAFAQGPHRQVSFARSPPHRSGSASYGTGGPMPQWPAAAGTAPGLHRFPARSFSGDNFPPSRYAHLDVDLPGVQCDEASRESTYDTATSGPSLVHSRSLSTGSLGQPTNSLVAPRAAVATGASAPARPSFASAPRQSYFVVDGSSLPERSKSVLSIRNADQGPHQGDNADEDDDEIKSRTQHSELLQTAPASSTPLFARSNGKIAKDRETLVAPLVQRDESNSSSVVSASTSSDASALPGTPPTPCTPCPPDSSLARAALSPKDPLLSRGGALANVVAADGGASVDGQQRSWTPSKWLVRGESTSVR